MAGIPSPLTRAQPRLVRGPVLPHVLHENRVHGLQAAPGGTCWVGTACRGAVTSASTVLWWGCHLLSSLRPSPEIQIQQECPPGIPNPGVPPAVPGARCSVPGLAPCHRASLDPF